MKKHDLFRNPAPWMLTVLHSVALCVSLVAAWFLRFDFSLPKVGVLLSALPLLIATRLTANTLCNLGHRQLRYFAMGDIKDQTRAIALGTIIFFAAERVLFNIRSFPYSIYILEAIFSFVLLTALRVGIYRIARRSESRHLGDPVQVMIVGAGAAASLLLQAISQTHYSAVGLVDDDPDKQRMKIDGVPVLGRIDQLPSLVRRFPVHEILIAIPSATGTQMFHITDACRRSAIPFRAVPSLASLIRGDLKITELHDVNLDDLLGREPVVAEASDSIPALNGSVVMVTGAAGSIGSELCHQILRANPRKLICLDQAETPLFHLQDALKAPDGVEIVYVVGDITDGENMRQQILRHRVRAIFHAAAYKHVPMTEANPYEGLRNNVFGLMALVDAADQAGCDDFLLISSDKAVKPSSLMGCTKRIGEMILGSRPRSGMRCLSVRFGNVLGSQGSVIPIFQDQIRNGGVITVTHPQMTRYFMTIPEAANLVLHAFSVGEHGDILVLDMGKPVRIVDLARTLTRVLGKRDDDVKIIYTGMRPGEKLHEDLFYAYERQLPTQMKKVMRAKSAMPDWITLVTKLHELRKVALTQSADAIRAKVKQIVPEYEFEPVVTAVEAWERHPVAEIREPALLAELTAISVQLAGHSLAGMQEQP